VASRNGSVTTHEVTELDGADASDASDADADDCELPIPITAVSREHVARFITNIPALDHVLGGGLVPGCSVLIGGDPGAAKSTMAIQAAAACARWNETRVLYVTGEENTAQVAERADRVGAAFERVYLIHETDPDRILRSAEKIDPEVLIVDSINTMARLDLPAMPGTVTQVRACAELLHIWCREHRVALILTGQVTKDGAIAGPNTLKHLVDAVLHLEAIDGSQLRVLRAHKNRNGDTGAVGRFMMSRRGLESIGAYSADVADPGEADPGEAGPGEAGPGEAGPGEAGATVGLVIRGLAEAGLLGGRAGNDDDGEIPDAAPITPDREPQDTDPVAPPEFAS
jgi:predicted ATP-dependent serine protease